MELVTIRTFDNSIDSHIWKSKLESEGIKCYLFDENMVSLNLLYNITVGGIKLKINESDFEKANKLIEDIESLPYKTENNEILECPNCKSNNLISDYKSIKGIKGILSFITSLFFMIFPFYFKRVYKCEECGTEFNQSESDK